VIYDIQENYYRNIIHTNVYPAYVKYPLAFFIRLKERLGTAFIDKYFLAEKIYYEQLSFTKDKAIILENKAVVPANIQHIRPVNRRITKFIYSGTIAEHYGIFDAIEFMKHIHKRYQNVELKIIGYAPDHRIYSKLLSYIEGINYIYITGGNSLVPHDQILKAMILSDFCLLPYQNSKSTEGRIPTKLYECLSLEIPVIASPDQAWNELVRKNNAGLIHDFKSPSIPETIFNPDDFYGHKSSGDYLWKNEAPKLIKAIEDLI
jgi:glycosyltransferase involved in cell wall biosynthesis